ncbi:MAG: hypothetical protein WKG07_18030 [Hymenobacter sp.]
MPKYPVSRWNWRWWPTTQLSDTRLDSPLAFLLRRYAHLKQFSANFLRHITFASAFHDDRFAQALAVVVELQTGARRKLPADVPTDFITPDLAGVCGSQREAGTPALRVVRAGHAARAAALGRRVRARLAQIRRLGELPDSGRPQWPSLRGESCASWACPRTRPSACTSGWPNSKRCCRKSRPCWKRAVRYAWKTASWCSRR